MKSLFNKWKKHIPNILTTLRLGAVPAFWVLTLTGNLLPATILFGSACATDALDGFLARRWNVQSIYGKITDPLADKMLVMSALLLHGITINPLMLIPLGLESGIAVVNVTDFIKNIKLRNILKKDYIKDLVINKKKGNVSQTGREKTIFLMSTISLGLLNSGLNLGLDKILNILIMLTSTMEAATLTEYIDAKIINKSDSQMRLPNFANQENKKLNEKEKVLVNDKQITNFEIKIEERIELLNKEKDSLKKINHDIVGVKKISKIKS